MAGGGELARALNLQFHLHQLEDPGAELGQVVAATAGGGPWVRRGRG